VEAAAGGLMFGVFFVAAGFGAVINGVQRTNGATCSTSAT
jgi:hypothetical protein